MSQTVIELARAKTAADTAYEQAFRAHLRSFKPLDTEKFWVILDQFKDEIIARVNRGTNVKDGAHNLMCRLVHNDDNPLKSWEDMVRFLSKYEEVSATLSKKCFEMKGLERGDDGYGDLMDSLPLAGRVVVDGIMSDDIANYRQLTKALAEHPLKKFILDGENYVHMTFERVLQKAFTSVTRDRKKDDDLPERVEPHVVLLVKPAKPTRSYGECQEITIGVRGPYKNAHEAEKYVEQEGSGIAVRVYSAPVLQ